jgi:hypothetical protein
VKGMLRSRKRGLDSTFPGSGVWVKDDVPSGLFAQLQIARETGGRIIVSGWLCCRHSPFAYIKAPLPGH